MKKRLLAIIMIMIMALGCFTAVSFGAGDNKKSTTYQVIKKGNYAYCGTTRGIYKVNLKKNKAKRIYTIEKEVALFNGGAFSLKLHKGYVYFMQHGPMTSSLHRVSTKGKNYKLINKYVTEGYSISNNKLYLSIYDLNVEETDKIICNLNGKSPRSSSFTVKMKQKKSNVKGYYIKTVNKGYKWDTYQEAMAQQYTEYLVKPSGKKIKLCTYFERA